MTLSTEEKKSLSDYRLRKARRLLEDAELLLRENRPESAINRSYYAAMTAAKGVLILFGIEPKSHEGIKTMVNKKLIFEGLMPKDFGKWFGTLLFEREDADYADYLTFDRKDAEEAFGNALRFVEKSEEVAQNIAKEM